MSKFSEKIAADLSAKLKGKTLPEQTKLLRYNAAIDAAFRHFKDQRACDEVFDAMCEWIEKRLLKRHKLRAMVSWGGTDDGHIKFSVTDLSRVEAAEFAGRIET